MKRQPPSKQHRWEFQKLTGGWLCLKCGVWKKSYATQMPHCKPISPGMIVSPTMRDHQHAARHDTLARV